MGKCSMCGKSGLFLKVNESGLCGECSLKVSTERERDLKAAREFVSGLSGVFADIEESGGRFPASDPVSWVDTKDVPLACVQRLRDDCSYICDQFPRWVEYPLFEEAFLEECVPDLKIKGCIVHPHISLGLLYTSRNEFDKKIPELLKKVRRLDFALMRYGKYEYKTFRVVGVTFQNEDGKSRQEILKKIRYKGAPYRTDPDIRLEKYEYEGREAVSVYANEEQIGNISDFDLDRVLPCWERYENVEEFSIHGTGEKTNKFGVDIVVRFRKSD